MKGLILAAGEGSRIRKVTYGAFPKELLPIGNVPTIRFPLEALRLADIRSVFVVIAPQTKHGIVDGLQSGRRFNMDICYIIQEKGDGIHSGIGSAILKAKRWIGQEDFAVALGDTIVCNFSNGNPMDCLKPLVEVHKRMEALATVLVHPSRSDPRRFGVVKFRSLQHERDYSYGEVDQMVEKPDEKVASTFKENGYCYMVAGYYMFKPSIFEYIDKTLPDVRNEIQITNALESAVECGEKVFAVVHARKEGDRILPYNYWDVGVPEDYRAANTCLLNENIDKWLSAEE